MKCILMFFVFISSFAFGQRDSSTKFIPRIEITEVKPIPDTVTIVEEINSPKTIEICLSGPTPHRGKHNQRDFNTSSKTTFTRNEIESMPKDGNILKSIR